MSVPWFALCLQPGAGPSAALPATTGGRAALGAHHWAAG